MRALLATVVTVAAIVAGCSAPAPQEALPPAGPQARVPWLLANGTAPVAEWQQFTLRASGAAGEWLVLYQPFATPVAGEADYGYGYSLTARAEPPGDGTPARMFLLAPMHMLSDDSLAPSGPPPFTQQGLLQAESGAVTVESVHPSIGSRHSLERTGVVLVAAANGPWSVELRYSHGEGNASAEPWWLARGSNATLHVGAERLMPVQGPADRLALEAEVDAGWTHLQVLNRRLQPDQVRSYEFTLPGGETRSGLGTQQGHDIPMMGGSAGSGGMVDAFGAMQDVAGTLSMELDYAQADFGNELGYVHLPLPGAPPGVAAGVYDGQDWPFADPAVPPLPVPL